MVSDVLRYISSLETAGGSSYIAGGGYSAYGTAYALLTKLYVKATEQSNMSPVSLLEHQDSESGYFVEPSMADWKPPEGAMHDREHLMLHSTCAVLPCLQQFNIIPRHPLSFSSQFRGAALREWLTKRDLTNPWLEGNNLLFAGQILLYLMKTSEDTGLKDDFETLMTWLDQHIDPKTGLWGTDHGAAISHGVYGGYHQLLLYFYTGKQILFPDRLVDCCLGLQALDGGYSPDGDGGACEDVDTVDILVNLYKRFEYRRSEIRWSLRRCARHILRIQNEDGGFPYCQRKSFFHNGLKGTEAGPGESSMFATWFRVHTLALIAEVLPEVASLFPNKHFFNSACSMGWHDLSLEAPPATGNALIGGKRLMATQFSQAIALHRRRLLAKAKGKIRSIVPR